SKTTSAAGIDMCNSSTLNSLYCTARAAFIAILHRPLRQCFPHVNPLCRDALNPRVAGDNPADHRAGGVTITQHLQCLPDGLFIVEKIACCTPDDKRYGILSRYQTAIAQHPRYMIYIDIAAECQRCLDFVFHL